MVDYKSNKLIKMVSVDVKVVEVKVDIKVNYLGKLNDFDQMGDIQDVLLDTEKMILEKDDNIHIVEHLFYDREIILIFHYKG